MTIYAIVAINVTDVDGYQEYVGGAIGSLQAAGVKVLVASDAPVAIEGQTPFGRFVVLEFEDRAAFDAWYESPAYQKARPIRHRTADTGYFLLVEGLA
jgi:uncharacterized protein (DUF1330 family)